MNDKTRELKPCPFCGGKIDLLILDDEFNVHSAEYEKAPFSGLQYGLCHPEGEKEECPISTFYGELLGVYCYDTKADAAKAWNRRR